MEQDLRIADLITAHIQGSISEPEAAELGAWLEQQPEHSLLFEKIVNERNLDADLAALKSYDSDAALEKIKQTEPAIHAPKTYPFQWSRIAAAASILIAVSAGGYFILHKKTTTQQLAQIQKQDILPGSNKAILTLANGQKVILTGAKNGQIAKQGLTLIQKKADGQLVYKATSAATAVVYNTMTTPRGGQYWVTLPDGSRVLLNAASSLTYPVAFNGNERKVTLMGEAYFEVIHNSKMPFRVVTKGETVEDIGTHFNINAYDDEPVVRTTLLEGGVRVAHNEQFEILKPGQEAVLKADELNVSDVDTEEAIAWKNGYFMFEDENIQPIMRKIARWYDVDVIYNGDLPTDKFWGTVSRFASVSEVLNKLALTDKVHFKIEGRRIMVSK